MKIGLSWALILAALILPSGASAQLVPSPTVRVAAGCPQQPEPAVLANMDFRERGNFGILLQNMYKAAAYSDIAQSGTCHCDQRFPAWEPVVAYYLENYAGETDRNTVRERETFYLRSSNTNRPAVRDICMAAGNW